MPDMSDSPLGPAVRPDGSAPDQIEAPAGSATPRRGRSTLWLWLFVLLAIVAALAWYRYRPAPATLPTAENAVPAAQTAAAEEVDSLRRSLDDAARVNRALREQVLGLTQRVGLVEDGLAAVERGTAPGVDAVRMSEADFLLRLGEERLRLFSDVAGARSAFVLADAQLTEVSDPRATSVRQTLALERDALAGVAVADLPVILGRLDGLVAAVQRWPLKGRSVEPAPGAVVDSGHWWSRLGGVLDRYFRVRRVDPAESAGAGPLLRERIALDLSRARLLLLRGEGAAAFAAIQQTRGLVGAQFDDRDAGVSQAIGVLDELLVAPLSPQFPSLGESRRELARLRGVPAVNDPATGAGSPEAVSDQVAPTVEPGPVEAPASDSAPTEAPAEIFVPEVDAPAATPASDDAVPDETSDADASAHQDA